MLCSHHGFSCRSVTSAGRQQRCSKRAQSARPILSRDTRNAALSASSALFSKDMFLLTCRATFKLAIGCAGIMLLMKSGRIPSTAPQVLSKLAFNVTIPSMLFVKSAETLASSQGDPRYLLVPLIAAVEVAIGFVLGGIAAAWAVRPAPPKPTKAEAAIAASVAGSVGSPTLAASLYPERTCAPAGMKAVVQTACAFGNALTMPLLFMLSLFPASVASVATGAVALFLLGWSPMFWTLGHSRINGAADAILAETAAQDTTQPSTEPSSSSTSSRYGIHMKHLEPSGNSPDAPPTTPTTPTTPSVVTTSTLPEEMGSLPGVAELRRLEASGTFLLPEAKNPNQVSGSSIPNGPNLTIPSNATGQSNFARSFTSPEEANLIAGPVRAPNDDDIGGSGTIDFSDFSSDSASSSDSEDLRESEGRRPAPHAPLSSADDPEIVSESDGPKPNGTNNGVPFDYEVPRRRMIPIADPLAKPDIQMPLLGRSRNKRQSGGGGNLLLGAGSSGKAPEWPWVASMRRILNPPLVATAGGLALGLSPFGPLLLTPTQPAVVAFVAELPWELAVVLSAMRCVAETGALLGSLTLGLQFIVLGASLIPSKSLKGNSGPEGKNSNSASNEPLSDSDKSVWASISDVLQPADRWEARQLIATSAVRLVFLPACTLALVHAVSCMGLLPPCKMCIAAILVMSCMPSAQNLVLLLNLRSESAALAPAMARLLLRQIMLAAVPMTVWISIFLSYLNIPTGF